MSEQTNQQPSGTVNGVKVEPLSPASTADDLSRHINRELDPLATAHLQAQGFPPELADELDDDDEEEEVDEDYVAVDHDDANEFPYWFRRPPVHHRTQLDELHPFTQVLTVSHVNDCVEVEEAFPEPERCTRDKFTYRLNRCPELCLGLFTLPILGDGEPKPRPTLVGHVVASRTSTVLVTDKAMQLPEDWRTERFSIKDGETVGHDEYGSTIAIHSLAVRPEHQGKQVARTLMKAYIQRIKEAQIAERISIISHDHLVSFYESFGFENRGPSKCQFGGGGWVDLVLEFTNE